MGTAKPRKRLYEVLAIKVSSGECEGVRVYLVDDPVEAMTKCALAFPDDGYELHAREFKSQMIHRRDPFLPSVV